MGWRRIWWRARVLPAAAVMAFVSTAGWLQRYELHDLFHDRPALLPAAAVGLFVWLLLGCAIFFYQDWLKAQRLRQRVLAMTGIPRVWPEFGIVRLIKRVPDPLEWLLKPVLQTAWGKQRAREWQQASFGTKGSRYLLILFGCAALMGVLAFQLGGALLAITLALIAPLAPYRLVASRARQNLALFSQQVPAALDAVAAGASAGLSFQQSLHFAAGELPAPMRDHLARVDRKLQLGQPVERVLERWAGTADEEGLTLAVDGILLQRQMGGDLIGMLQRSAQLARDRIELQQEVQAVTAQGRLSAWVIGGLVPISAALLLASNPRYIDVLFNTLLGQVLLVIAIGLQLLGWLIISRLIRVRY